MFFVSLRLVRTIHRLAAHSLVEVDLMAVELGTVHAREEHTAVHAHAAVPSTISALSDTVVGSEYSRVVRVTNFIIIIGPMATHSS